MAKMKASLKEKIEKGMDGRTQTHILGKLKDKGVFMSDSQFSRKKLGREKFKPEELEVLSEILNVDLGNGI